MNKIQFNINEYVRVKLTDRGREIVKENHNALYTSIKERVPYFQIPDYTPPKENNGWSRWQLWALMKEFGSHIIMGIEPPFETTIEIELP